MQLNEDIAKQKYIQLKNYDEQLQLFQRQLQRLDTRLVEIDSILGNVEDLKKIRDGTNAMVTLSPGIFLQAQLQKTQEFFVNVGEGSVVKKDASQLQEFMKNQQKELMQLRDTVLREYKKVDELSLQLEMELQTQM